MAVPSLADVKATLITKASALGLTAGKSTLVDFLISYLADVIAQPIYDHAASRLDGSKQVVYDNDNLYPRLVASQASTVCAAGNTTFGPYSRTSSNDRLFLCYWTATNTAGMGIGPDTAGAVDIAIWIQRTAVADQFEVVVANNTGANKNVEFAVMALRFT